MLTQSNEKVKVPDIEYITPKGWPKGLYTRLDTFQTPIDGLNTTDNVMLNQNGTVGPRPGLRPYGVQPTGTVIGKPFEFVRLDTTVTPNVPETWMIWMENQSGTGRIVYSKDGGSHNVIGTHSYSITGNPHFEQVYGKVLITTGVDSLSYMDVQTFAITTFTALTTPNAPTVTPTGLTGSTYTLRYRVAAANQGETAASSATSITVSKIRDSWNGTGEYVTITGNRITNAQRYNIYVGDAAGFEYFLDSVVDPGTGSTFTYVDTGAIALTATRVAPTGDSTSGPKTTRATNIKGQVYMVGDTENLGRIWFGGNGASALDFSSYNGGGWVEPNKGGKDFPVKVVPFRDGKGTPMAACLSKGTNGAGKRYLLQPATTTLGDTVISYMAVQEDNGQDGTDSPDGVVVINDGIWYPSRTGFKTSNTKANIQNIISTSGISDNIAPNVTALSALYMDKCVGLAVDQRIYWSLPFASEENNQIWVLDLRQQGAWVLAWQVACSAMWLYADNTDGKTKHLGLVDNQFMEFDQGTATNDDGEAFITNVGSGSIKFGKNGEWANVLDVTFVFLRPQGDINVTVTAETEDEPVILADTLAGTSTQSVSAFGAYGWSQSGWGNLVPYSLPYAIASSKARRTKRIEVEEEVNMLTWGVGSVDAGVSYQLAEVIIRYVPVGYKEIDDL